MSAGELRAKIALDAPSTSNSNYGKAKGAWSEQFRLAARIRPLLGSEPVIAQRLAGVQPAVITIRSSVRARTITAAWRVRDVRRGVEYQIRSVTPGERPDYIDLLCESGVAQ